MRKRQAENGRQKKGTKKAPARKRRGCLAVNRLIDFSKAVELQKHAGAYRIFLQAAGGKAELQRCAQSLR
jgi:hypothetical protein